jgi:hypothetical protein
MKLNAPALEELPEQYREGNRANSVLITRLIQIYLGQSTGGIKALLDMIFRVLTALSRTMYQKKITLPHCHNFQILRLSMMCRVALIDHRSERGAGGAPGINSGLSKW